MAIRMGIIGFGYMGKWHLNNAPKVENVSVVAAYDIVPERVKAAEEAGLKGFSCGGAEVSELHAGFVINRGGATCADVLELVRRVQEKVKADSGVNLEMEVKILR